MIVKCDVKDCLDNHNEECNCIILKIDKKGNCISYTHNKNKFIIETHEKVTHIHESYRDRPR